MRCSAKRVTQHKVTFSFVNGSATRNLHLIRPSGTFPSRGRQSRNHPRGSQNKRLLPRTRKLSPLCTPSLSVTAPGLPVPWGVSGGGAALSSLCRRFPGGDIMNLTSRRSPLSGLSFSLFFFLRERKRGYRQRSRKISVDKAKPEINPLSVPPPVKPRLRHRFPSRIKMRGVSDRNDPSDGIGTVFEMLLHVNRRHRACRQKNRMPPLRKRDPRNMREQTVSQTEMTEKRKRSVVPSQIFRSDMINKPVALIPERGNKRIEAVPHILRDLPDPRSGINRRAPPLVREMLRELRPERRCQIPRADPAFGVICLHVRRGKFPQPVKYLRLHPGQTAGRCSSRTRPSEWGAGIFSLCFPLQAADREAQPRAFPFR